MKFVLSTSFSSIAHLRELAVTADNALWSGMSFSDHVVHPKLLSTPYPYTDDGSRRWEAFTDWPDPFVMIGALSSITKNLRFMNNVFVLPMRNPFMAAKTIATAAIVSDNRVTLCIGVGWSKDEFELMGQDFHTRGKRCDEMVEILRLLWTGEWVEYHGQHYQFEALEMSPAPSQNVPLWVGGISDAALRRAARLGDGWISDLQSSDDIITSIKKINQYRKEYSRDQLPFDVLATPNDAFTVDGYQRLKDQGVTHILTMPWPFYSGDSAALEDKIAGIKRYSDDIIQKMCDD
jgi:probable F420-dependent oxidoreductase